jgi:hypothetical protein
MSLVFLFVDVFEQAQLTRTFKQISPLSKYVNSFIKNTIIKTFNDPLRYEFIFMDFLFNSVAFKSYKS